MAQNVIINGVVYSSVPEVNIPISGGGTAEFYDTSDATLDNGGKMLNGYTAYANGVKYTGSIPTKTSADMTVSGGTVTAPAGYYASSTSKAIPNGSATTPTTTITVTPSFSINTSTGVVTATASASKSITPTVSAGYISTGTAGTVSASGSNTYTLASSSIVEGVTTTSGTTASRGTATWNTGWIQSGEMDAAVFANTATAGVTYKDISATTDAPVLITGDYLYINKGYTDDLKISLARLVPDGASASLASNVILSGYSAYDNNGVLVAGNIQSKGATTYNTSSSDQTIASGVYLSGNQIIKAVKTANISPENVKYGVTIKVGDANDDDRITSAAGTFTGASTVSTGQTGAGASQILEGYSAFLNGAEVQGTMAANGAVGGTITTKSQTVTIPAGYTTGGSVSISSTEQAKIIAGNIKSGVTILGQSGSSTVVDTAISSNAANAGRIFNGYKAYVNGELITGNMTVPVVSQNASTKVLTIS